MDAPNRLVSIGLATHNRSAKLRGAIVSLLTQRYGNIELIVSDNASPDSTEEVCMEFVRRDKRVRYFRQDKNIGAMANFNFVLQKAQGNFFMWASDDDLWHKDFIQVIMERYMQDQNERYSLITTQSIGINDKDDLKRKPISIFQSEKEVEVDFQVFLKSRIYLYRAIIFYGVYRISRLRDIGGYNTVNCISSGDQLTLYALLRKGNALVLPFPYFYKRIEFFFETFLSSDYSVMQRIKTFLGLLLNILLNLLPHNLIYLLSRVQNYFCFTQRLFWSCSCESKKILATLYNLLSSTELLLDYFVRKPSWLRDREHSLHIPAK